jgi:hypothetical protein
VVGFQSAARCAQCWRSEGGKGIFLRRRRGPIVLEGRAGPAGHRRDDRSCNLRPSSSAFSRAAELTSAEGQLAVLRFALAKGYASYASAELRARLSEQVK